QRSGQYEALNVIEVYEGELLSWNRLTEKFEFDPNGKLSDVVIGYVGYFKLLNGFEKTVYWTKQEVEAHRIRNNKTKNKTELSGVWKTDYDSMAKKTILRNILSKWGILSIEMQKAVTTDETVQTLDKETGDIRDITPDEDFDAAPIQEPDKLGTFVTEDGEIINLEDEAAQESLFEERTIKPKE
ncbi:MAG: recombinase RecT, partial [Clostridia bacterium]|nr:recombinase RecT [Clostridia bacterium]